MAKRGNWCWKITGYNGSKLVFQRRVPSHELGTQQARELLIRLVAQNLDVDEIIQASSKRNARRWAPHFEIVPISNKKFGLMTTGNPHYTLEAEEISAG